MHFLFLQPADHFRSRVRLHFPHFPPHEHRSVGIRLRTKSARTLKKRTDLLTWSNSERPRVLHFSTNSYESPYIIPSGTLRNSKNVPIAQKLVFRSIASRHGRERDRQILANRMLRVAGGVAGQAGVNGIGSP